jgi:hypothetical protein
MNAKSRPTGNARPTPPPTALRWRCACGVTYASPLPLAAAPTHHHADTRRTFVMTLVVGVDDHAL